MLILKGDVDPAPDPLVEAPEPVAIAVFDELLATDEPEG
jgi:hypothetical protein